MNKGTKVSDSSPFKGEQEGVRAIILAAGTASRLRPLTSNTPKCLLKVGERTLLERSMDALIKAGIHDFVIVTGYLHEQIENFVRKTYQDLLPSGRGYSLSHGRGLGRGYCGSFRFIHNKDYETTNNIYSLWLARPEAEGQEILLLDSDLLYDGQIVERVLADKHENVLTLIRHELGEEEMKVVIDPPLPSLKGRETLDVEASPLRGGLEGSITEISKTCSPTLAAGESLGIERMGEAYTTALYKELDLMMNTEHLENTFYELAFQRLIPQGHTFSVLDVTDLFSCELDTVEDFENAKQRIPAHLY